MPLFLYKERFEMEHNYPHLDDTKFPDLNTVNAYKYKNDYPYDAYGITTKIKLMNVPWCGDYENTVYFETKDKRDAWFEGNDGVIKEMPTMFRLYAGGDIKVELPIDECMKFNYVMIDYGKLHNQADESGYSKMFYFISDMQQDSVNTTRLMLNVDYWTSYIYDMGITYVNLQRGHAPMAETSVEEYLSNPLDESEYLLTPDVSYGSLQRVTSEHHEIFNAYTGSGVEQEITIGFQTNASMQQASLWPDMIPTAAYESSQAFSCVDPFILDNITYWDSFRENVMATYPHFFETVKGMFIIPKKLVTYYEEDDFTFCGVPCHFLASHSDIKQADFKITKGMFDYPEQLSDITKLYTAPYACIEVNDFKGNTLQVNVEDTTGTIGIHTIMCDMYPFMNVEAYLTGVGGTGKSSILFQNNYTHTMTIGGRFYDFRTKWSIPVFAVQLEADKNWELNGKIGADATVSNTNASAANITANAGLQVALNSANTTLANDLLTSNNDNTVTVMNDKMKRATYATLTSTNTEIQSANAQASVSGNALTTKATVGAVVGIASTIFEIGAAAADNPAAGLSAAVSGVGGVVSGAVNAAVDYGAMMDGVQISNGLKQSIVEINTSANNFFNDRDVWYNNTASALQAEYNSETTTNANTMTTTSAENNANTMSGNARTSYDAKKKQMLLTNPPEFGQMTGTQDIVSKPFGLSFNVITQSRNAIRQAGEQMLRYGYVLNMQWKVGTFNVMPKFSYWQCSSVYCNDNGVYEGAQNMVKSILQAGVTVWRDPSLIGITSIYDN